MATTEKPFGRPTKYKKRYCQELVEHMKEGRSFRTFAAKIDCNPDTLYEWLKHHPEFSDARKKASVHCQIWWEDTLRAASRGKIMHFNATAAVWATKNILGWNEKQQLEVMTFDGSDSKPDETPEEKKKRLNDIITRWKSLDGNE